MQRSAAVFEYRGKPVLEHYLNFLSELMDPCTSRPRVDRNDWRCMAAAGARAWRALRKLNGGAYRAHHHIPPPHLAP